ncbi:hypothetical protein BDL97_17G106000 [Sphagnum fallax]|jgi:hypothetical protein|nr:hypothetical protein BDL97_17G106000 [Sphagnum fallax]
MLDLQNNSRDWKTQHGKFSSSRTKQAVIILGIYRSHNIDRVAIGQAELRTKLKQAHSTYFLVLQKARDCKSDRNASCCKTKEKQRTAKRGQTQEAHKRERRPAILLTEVGCGQGMERGLENLKRRRPRHLHRSIVVLAVIARFLLFYSSKNSVFLITHKKAEDGFLDKKRT